MELLNKLAQIDDFLWDKQEQIGMKKQAMLSVEPNSESHENLRKDLEEYLKQFEDGMGIREHILETIRKQMERTLNR